jgi:hypothetical protein
MPYFVGSEPFSGVWISDLGRRRWGERERESCWFWGGSEGVRYRKEEGEAHRVFSGRTLFLLCFCQLF